MGSDRGEGVPVGFAAVLECSDSVVGEGAEPERCSFDAFDGVVELATFVGFVNLVHQSGTANPTEGRPIIPWAR